jgi:hypothetical protein
MHEKNQSSPLPKIDSAAIATLHHEYRHLTGHQLTLDFHRERVWWDWCQRGHDIEELRMVVAYLKFMIKKGERFPGSLKFHNLIGNPDYFEEDLSTARAHARKPKIDYGKQEALRATGRTENHTSPPRTAAQVMADEEAFKKFREFGKTL